MNNSVIFDNDNYGYDTQYLNQNGFLIDFLIKRGLAKDKQSAIYVLLAVIILSLVLVVLMFLLGSSDSVGEIPKNEAIIYPKDGPPRLVNPIN